MIQDFFRRKRIQKIERIIAEMSQGKSETAGESKALKREKKIILFCSSFLSLLLVAAIIAGTVANHFLGKINFGDIQGVVGKNLEAEEEIDFDIAEYEVIGGEDSYVDFGIKKSTDRNNISGAEPSTQKRRVSSNGTGIKASYNYKVNETKSKEIQKKANEDIKNNVEEAVTDGIWYSKDVFNLLIVGYDAGDREAVMFEGADLPRSDAIIIASVNTVKKTVKLVSLSRATYAAIPGHGNKRINTAHAFGGAKTLIDTIEMNYRIKIDRFISVDFDGFKEIVDILDGVPVKLTAKEAQFAFDDNAKKAGTYTMNGKQALRYVRFRKADSDRARTGRQRKVLESIAAKAKKMSSAQTLDFMNKVLPYVTTNFTKSELIVKAGELPNYLSWPMTQDIIPHTATKLTMRDGKEVLILDWAETSSYVHSILYSGVQLKQVPLK